MLPHHQGKCSRLHGHSWVERVYVSSDRLETTGLESPTSEAIAQWIFEKLEAAKLPGLCMVEIR